VHKSAEADDESALMHEETVNQQKKPIDEELTNDLSILVGIGHEILILLKCIIGLVCLVLFGIVYIVSRL
jgi:hypothetical protein